MAALGAPHRVVADGGLIRSPGQDRIAFLAAARNAALEPLWEAATEPVSAGPRGDAADAAAQRAVADRLSRRLHAESEYAAAGRAQSSNAGTLRCRQQAAAHPAAAEALSPEVRAGRRIQQQQQHARGLREQSAGQNATSETVTAASKVWRGGDRAPFRADRVLFLNDVYFCAEAAARLLRHDADMACGMDFDRPAIRQMSRQVWYRMHRDKDSCVVRAIASVLLLGAKRTADRVLSLCKPCASDGNLPIDQHRHEPLLLFSRSSGDCTGSTCA